MPSKQTTVAEAGRKGGKARAKNSTPKQRSELARLAANARWKKVSGARRSQAY